MDYRLSNAGTKNVIIVSRDGDFGISHDREVFLNDWLKLEFKQRVSRTRKIELTNGLSVALKKLSVDVNAADVKEEDRLLVRWSAERSSGVSMLPRRLSNTIFDASNVFYTPIALDNDASDDEEK